MVKTVEINKAKTLLEKALKEDPYYLPAVFELEDIYAKVRDSDFILRYCQYSASNCILCS